MAILEITGVLLYGIGALGLIVDLFRRRTSFRWYSAIILAVGFGVGGVHLVARALSASQAGALPLAGAHAAFSFLAWIVVAIALLVHIQFRLYTVSALLTPMAVLCAVVSFIIPGTDSVTSPNSSVLFFSLHVSLLFVGIGSFALAFFSGLVHLITQHELKSKRFGRFLVKLPPLEVVDQVAVWSLVTGFLFLSVGMITGVYMAHSVWTSDWTRDPKVIFSLVTWVWYAILLGVRWRSGWRGGRFFVLIVIGFVFILFTFLGVFLFFPVSGGEVLRPAEDLLRSLSWT